MAGDDAGGVQRVRADVSSRQEDRTSPVSRGRSWYGLKKYAKRLLALRVPHLLLRLVVHFRPELRETGRLPAPAHLREIEGRVDGTSFVMLRPDRCVVAKELYWGRGLRPRTEDAFALSLFGRLASDCDAMLDIGAYTGLFTLAGTKVNPSLTGHAFEIVPDVFAALQANCARNGILERVGLHHVGIGDPDTVARFPAESGGSALPDFYSSRVRFGTGRSVPFRSLDSVSDLLREGCRLVLKIDVEGTEDDVLRHGQGLLAQFRPDIICEVLPDAGSAEDVEAFLAPHGYRFFLVQSGDLLSADRLLPNPRFRDWLFTTKSPTELAALGFSVETPRGAPRPAMGRRD